MKALCWYGKFDVRVDEVPEPQLLNPRDAIVKVTTTCICGSDLHLYDGMIPTLEKGDILGHEFMGEIVELGSGVSNLKISDRVIVPFTIACGNCYFCKNELWSACENSNPNAVLQKKAYGQSGSALFGYTHLMGGYAGGQAEYVRVPFADVGPYKVPDHLTDEQVVFLTDILPTGYQAAVNADITPGDTIAVWGCGPVGQFAIQSAYALGAEKVIAIDRQEGRLKMAAEISGAIPLNYEKVPLAEVIGDLTGGRGPDSVIDAVGMEACGHSIDAIYDRIALKTGAVTDRAHALREAIQMCAKGGTVSIPGVYGGLVDKMPMGVAFGKGLTFKMGQTHVMKHLDPLMKFIESGKIKPERIITHRMKLADAAEGYKKFSNEKDDYIKVVLQA